MSFLLFLDKTKGHIAYILKGFKMAKNMTAGGRDKNCGHHNYKDEESFHC